MCSSLVPLKLPPPADPTEPWRRRESDNEPRYRVVGKPIYYTAYENDEDEAKKVKGQSVEFRHIYFDEKGAEALAEFLRRYPGLDAWRVGSKFSVEKLVKGQWRKIWSPPFGVVGIGR